MDDMEFMLTILKYSIGLYFFLFLLDIAETLRLKEYEHLTIKRLTFGLICGIMLLGLIKLS